MRKLLTLLLSLLLISSCSDDKEQETAGVSAIPKNKTEDFSYKLHDVTVRDPYHWLEIEDSSARNDWLDQQQRLTQDYFSLLIPKKGPEYLNQVSDSDFHILLPKILNNKIYYLKQSPLRRQLSLQRWNLSTNEAELAIELGVTNKTPVESSLSPGGRYYAVLWRQQDSAANLASKSTYQWLLFDLANKKYTNHLLPETGIRTHLHWLDHNRSILISNGNQVIRQKLIPESSKPQVIFDIGRLVTSPLDWEIDVQISTDKSALVIKAVNTSKGKSQFWAKSLSLNDPFAADSLIQSSGRDYRFIGSHGDTFYFLTTLAAPRGRIISINRSKPASKYWREVIEEQDGVLVNGRLINNEWLLHYVDNTRHRWFTSRLNGTSQKPIDIPHFTETKIEQVRSSNQHQVLLTSSSVLTPGEIFSLNFVNRDIKLLHSGRKSLNQLESKVFFYRSTDGSRIPLTIYSKGPLSKNDTNRVLLATHQGLGQHFSGNYEYLYKQWLDSNGIIAIPHIRGGGTYGLAWRDATTSSQQLKAAEDLNAAIDWLVDKNYTSEAYVTAFGENNAATFFLQAVMLAPDKWKALVLQNPNADFIQYYQTNDTLWLDHLEIDSSKQGIAKLLAMSPYQNFPKSQYPATLVIDTVSQKRQSKLVALWQNSQLAESPILLMNANNGLFSLNGYDWPIEDLSYQFLKHETGLTPLKPLTKKAL